MSNPVTISVQLSHPLLEEGGEISQRVKVRLFSEWLECSCTSDIFGGEELEWIDNSEDPELATQKLCTFNALYEADISSTEKLNALNEKPGIYAVFMTVEEREDGSESLTPIGFTYVDCSSFVLAGSTLSARCIKVLNFEAQMTVKTENALMPREELLGLEPVLIELNR